jgi:hypothetical protein
MCDPISLAVTAFAGATAYSARQGAKAATEAARIQADAQGDPAAERARAEAEAAQRANAKLAADQRRRRDQGSLLAKGAPAPTFSLGDAEGSEGLSPIGAPGSLSLRKPTSRSTVAQQSSLITRGAPSYGGGGRLGGGQVALQ